MSAQHARMLIGCAWAALLLGLVSLSGCLDLDGDDEVVIVEVDTTPPVPPAGVVSVSGDEEVRLTWYPNTEPDLDRYRVYWSSTAEGPYALVGSTRINRFVDRDVANGVTYFYAVTAVDDSGNESELSVEIVHDTPRPEGYGLVLWDYRGENGDLSGYDFSAFVRRPYDAELTDVFYGVDGGRHVMIATDAWTDLQDAGYASLDELDWAPPAGWSDEGRVTLIEGHCYYVWTRDDHFAKFRVVALDAERAEIDWAYQTDKYNPELMAGRGAGAAKGGE